MAQQINWQQPSGSNAVRKLRRGITDYYNANQCRDVIYALHSMHTSFDTIISMRSTTGTLNGISQLSFMYGLTLDKYLNDNRVDINNATRNEMCEFLFDNPGVINGSNGLLGWYFIDQRQPVLCQIISPWDKVRDVAVRNLEGGRGEHYAKYQLKQWVDKYKKSWKIAEEYEGWKKQAIQNLKQKKSGQKLRAIEIKKEVTRLSGIIKATNYPFIPEACGEFFGVEDSEEDLIPQETATNIAKVLWENNYLLDDENSEDQSQLLKIVKDITSKGFVRNNYKKNLVDLSDVKISLKGKK